MPNSLTSYFPILVGKKESYVNSVLEVIQLTYISFALRLLFRDRLYSAAYGLVGALVFTFFLLTIRIHFHLYGGVSLTSIVSFDQSPQILFYSTSFALMALFFFHCLHGLGDIGVMMAIGGNRLGCIWLHSLSLFFLFLPSFLMAILINLAYLNPPADFGFINEIKSVFSCLVLFITLGLLVSVPTIGISSFIDPYKSIRRQK
ncbi:ABC transporter permease [Leptospira mtsangambouensis]|uniref:ABC transporter permease n=1 Tax=Leptospira mtsangambouensis TaxID=2484912 RepID=UPI001EEA4F2A|nr:ABC transporter permease [Leptospira mtsangambouensis]MCG6141063.1 ABC transporter permease [Leptospira mtsangambouensis]